MINKIATKFLAAVGLTIAMVGCVKKDDFFSTSTSGENTKSIIKIMDGGTDINQRARNVNPAIDTFLLLEVRRDPKTSAELNQSLTVKVANDTGVIGRYNRAHGTSYQQLPSSFYTLLTDVNTLTFQPGEISKEIKIRFDKTNLDLSKLYALGFKITDAGGAIVSAERGEAIYAVGVKNKYDGIYSIESGKVQRYSAPGVQTTDDPLNGDVSNNPDVILATAGANAVNLSALYWANGGGVGGIGSPANVRLDIDPVTYDVKISNSTNTTLTNQPGKRSYYDPATKMFYLYFYWNPTGAVREYEMVIKYVGPR